MTRVTSGRCSNCWRRIAAERSRLPSLTKRFHRSRPVRRVPDRGGQTAWRESLPRCRWDDDGNGWRGGRAHRIREDFSERGTDSIHTLSCIAGNNGSVTVWPRYVRHAGSRRSNPSAAVNCEQMEREVVHADADAAFLHGPDEVASICPAWQQDLKISSCNQKNPPAAAPGRVPVDPLEIAPRELATAGGKFVQMLELTEADSRGMSSVRFPPSTSTPCRRRGNGARLAGAVFRTAPDRHPPAKPMLRLRRWSGSCWRGS